MVDILKIDEDRQSRHMIDIYTSDDICQYVECF